MGADFGDVRVHTGDTAVQTSRDLSARAYTVGSDIAFGAGEYELGTEGGRRLVAHELTHVVQQGGAGEVRRERFEEEDKATKTTTKSLGPAARMEQTAKRAHAEISHSRLLAVTEATKAQKLAGKESSESAPDAAGKESAPESKDQAAQETPMPEAPLSEKAPCSQEKGERQGC